MNFGNSTDPTPETITSSLHHLLSHKTLSYKTESLKTKQVPLRSTKKHAKNSSKLNLIIQQTINFVRGWRSGAPEILDIQFLKKSTRLLQNNKLSAHLSLSLINYTSFDLRHTFHPLSVKKNS